MKTKFEIVLELYKKEQITAEQCSILMEKEKEYVYLGYPSFYNPYPSFPLIQKSWWDNSNWNDLSYCTTTSDNSFSTINDKSE